MKGDQLVMVGEECLIGMSLLQAKQVLERAPVLVELVAQRKEPIKQLPTLTPTEEVDIDLRKILTARKMRREEGDGERGREEERKEGGRGRDEGWKYCRVIRDLSQDENGFH